MADTLLSEIVVQAFREGNFIATGESTTTEELAEAMPRLRNLISTILGFELGEQYREWYVPTTLDPVAPTRYPLTPTGDGSTSATSYIYPPANVRLVVKITASKTLYLPATPRDGARIAYADMGSTVTADLTLDGNGRLIEDMSGSAAASIVTDLDAVTPVTFHGQQWLYRSDLGTWKYLDPALASTDTMPLPPEFDDLFVCGLAMRLSPRFGTQVDQVIAERYADMLQRCKKRYKQSENMPSSVEMRQMFREI